MVGHVYWCIDLFEVHQLPFDPFTNGKIFDVHMSYPRSRLLRITHGNACAIVFVKDSYSLRRNSQVPQHTVKKRIIIPVLYAAIYLASLDDRATVGWNFDLYAIVPPASCITAPPKESLVLTHVAQLVLAYACNVFTLCLGQLLRSRSYLLLFIVGRGPSGNSRLGAVLQK